MDEHVAHRNRLEFLTDWLALTLANGSGINCVYSLFTTSYGCFGSFHSRLARGLRNIQLKQLLIIKQS